MFDISSKKVVETGTVLLNDASECPLIGEGGKQCSIQVYGPGSAQYAAAEARRNNKAVDRYRRKGKAKASAEEQQADRAEKLAAITIAFNGFSYPPAGDATGKDLFRAFYMDRELGFITEQVEAYVGDWENFTGKSETNSSSSSEASPG